LSWSLSFPQLVLICKPETCVDHKTAYTTFAMVKLTSFIAFSTLVIVPTFAAVIPIIEARDVVVAEPHFFGRDMEGLFTREQEFELPDLARRFLSGAAEDTSELVRRGVESEGGYVFTKKDLAVHAPFKRHRMEELDPKLDNHPSSDINDDDLSERSRSS